jgi:hypothetical protein
MAREILIALVGMVLLAAAFLALVRGAPSLDFPLVAASAPVYANPQCAVPTLDYSKRPRRLDWKAIA